MKTLGQDAEWKDLRKTKGVVLHVRREEGMISILGVIKERLFTELISAVT